MLKKRGKNTVIYVEKLAVLIYSFQGETEGA
jgi:hypothetical protein